MCYNKIIMFLPNGKIVIRMIKKNHFHNLLQVSYETYRVICAILAHNILWKNEFYCLWKMLLIDNEKKFPTVSDFWENLISIFMCFWKAELLSCSAERSEGKIAMPQALFLKIPYLRCLWFWIKFSRKHFWWLCFMTYAPECCFPHTAICHHFFFWSWLAHVPCFTALWLLFHYKDKFIPSQNSYKYIFRES